MRKIKYFNYPKLAKELSMPLPILKQIEAEVSKEFPSDEMMYELHVMRAIKSKYWQKDLKAAS